MVQQSKDDVRLTFIKPASSYYADCVIVIYEDAYSALKTETLMYDQIYNFYPWVDMSKIKNLFGSE